MVDHIKARWAKEKGVGMDLGKKHFKLLGHLTRHYEAEGVMALWDMWWERGREWSDFASRTGRSIEGFVAKIPALLDDGRWKAKREAYKRDFGRDAFTLANRMRTAGDAVRTLGVV